MELTDLGFELRHVGINCNEEQEAVDVAGRFEQIFGFTCKAGSSSVFAGTAVEAMKQPYLGKNGHIAIGTTDVGAAVTCLESQGITFNQESAKFKEGKMIAIYLNEEIGGFAVHLVQK